MASAHVLNAVPSVYPSWFGYAMIVSPAFITLLLTKVFPVMNLTKASGIPPLEKHMDEKYSGRKDYEAYKSNTPIFIPKL